MYRCLVLLHWLNVLLDLVDHFFHALSQYYKIGANSSKVWLMTGAIFVQIFSFNFFFF